jgi:large subunit ribosomal protein L25
MSVTTLTAHTGRETGSAPTRRLRGSGRIPGVVYGHGVDPVPVAVVAREFQIAMSGEGGLNTLLTLEVDGTKHLALARDVQHHPVRNVVTHVDFLVVDADQQVGAEVPVSLVGEATEVTGRGGIVDQLVFSVQVTAKPTEIPSTMELDITSLTIGGSLHVSDITVPAGVVLETDGSVLAASGLAPRVKGGGAAGDAEGGAEAEAAGDAGSAEG